MFHTSRNCVKEVIRERGFDKDSSVGKFVHKVAVRSDVRPKLEKRELLGGGNSSEEVLEIINSFRTPFTIPIVRMEQVGFFLSCTGSFMHGRTEQGRAEHVDRQLRLP